MSKKNSDERSLMEAILPGKAFEILELQADNDLKKVLASGEKRNKGRGYRVYLSLDAGVADKLASILNGREPANIIEYQATKTALERLNEIASPEARTELAAQTRARNLQKAQEASLRARSAKAEKVERFLDDQTKWFVNHKPLPADSEVEVTEAQAKRLRALREAHSASQANVRTLALRASQARTDEQRDELRGQREVAVQIMHDNANQVQSFRLTLVSRKVAAANQRPIPQVADYGLTLKDVS